MNHTPEPLARGEQRENGSIPIREGVDGFLVATVHPDDSGREISDALLIAAAPTLLAACIAAQKSCEALNPRSVLNEILKLAIARATEQTP